MKKWNTLDELQDEFSYHDENIKGYVWRSINVDDNPVWNWYVSKNNKLSYRGTAKFTIAAFEQAEKIIDELQN